MRIFNIVLITAGVALAQCSWAQDVYVAYAGKDKKEKNAITQAFPDSLSIKSYNVDLLGIADYSGVQKAAAKLSRAKVVLLLKDAAAEMLKRSKINADLIIVNSLKQVRGSSEGAIYILSKAEDMSGVLAGVRRVEVASKSELQDISDLRAGAIVVVDEANISTSEAAAILAEVLSKSDTGLSGA